MSWLHRPDVHGGEVSAGVVSGLVAPTAPDEDRWETLWHYMQSGQRRASISSSLSEMSPSIM